MDGDDSPVGLRCSRRDAVRVCGRPSTGTHADRDAAGRRVSHTDDGAGAGTGGYANVRPRADGNAGTHCRSGVDSCGAAVTDLYPCTCVRAGA